jgi:hypothetical protein
LILKEEDMMNCPNCGTAEKARVKVCPECNQAYASQDLLEMRQLEYLIKETESWPVANSTRSEYEIRLERLRERLISPPEEKITTEPEPITTPEVVKPYVTIEKRTKVYSGPGTQFPSLGFVSRGKEGKLIGASLNRDWWVIMVPTSYSPDGQGWIRSTEVTAHNTQDLRIILAPPVPEEVAPTPEVTIPKPAVTEPKPSPPTPPKEKVPFDQWLLSERNIKIALYSGGLLLLIAGIIFIGVNWTRIPGAGKFAITLMVTGLMYLGGFLLFQRPAYRIGGVALLGIASGFFVLNFAVLQIYVLGPRGMADTVMWLIASPFCLLLYMLTAYWTKSDLFTYLSMAAAGSLITASLVVAGAPELAFLLAYASLALVLLLLARGFKNSQLADFTFQPLMITSHILAPLTFLGAFAIMLAKTGFSSLTTGSLWLTLPIFIIGTIFYCLNALWSKKSLFTYICLVALWISMIAVLQLTDAPTLIYLLTYALYSLIMLFLARGVKSSTLAEFTEKPLTVAANILMPLTYLVTFVYILVPSSNVWFGVLILGIGSVFYPLITYWSRLQIFTFATLASIVGLIFAVLLNLQVPIMVYPMVYSVLGLAYLFLERAVQDTSIGEFTRIPLLITSQIVMPLVVVMACVGWISREYFIDYPWLALATLGLAVLFYTATDFLFRRLEARWAAAILFPITFGMTLFQLNFSYTAIGISFMILALAYLGLGFGLESGEKRKAASWPLYATAYVIAGLVTFLAIPNRDILTKILFADVVLLVVSAAIHRSYWWVCGAVWLFILPVYLTISLYVAELPYQGLLMGLLGLNYAAAGYLLGRRKLALGAPFLTAAVFLSVVTIGLTWVDPLIATLVMAVSAILYLLAALWLNWSWLLFPVLLMVNLSVVTINILVFDYQDPIDHAFTISTALLGVFLSLGALILRRRDKDEWSWPLYIIGAINISGAYLVSLIFVDWLTIGISTVFSTLLLSYSLLERDFIKKTVKFPLLTYLGISVLFIGYFYLLNLIGGEGDWDFIWPTFAAGLCGLFVVLAWLLRKDLLNEIYGVPLRLAGIWLMLIPLIGSLVLFTSSMFDEANSIIVAITFGIAGVTYLSDAAGRRIISQAYLGLGSFIIVIWAVLKSLGVSEPQAYIIPPGLTLLAVGWFERSRTGEIPYRVLTYAGLILLLGSALIQSIPSGAYNHAILLGVESILAIGWGMRSHCRCYVQIGGIAFLANAIVQLVPGFIDLPRWIQIGLTGTILLGAGMAALFRREQILNTRRRLTDEWRQWNP